VRRVAPAESCVVVRWDELRYRREEERIAIAQGKKVAATADSEMQLLRQELQKSLESPSGCDGDTWALANQPDARHLLARPSSARSRGRSQDGLADWGQTWGQLSVTRRRTTKSLRNRGEPGGNRTHNPQIKSLLLCQLSYRPDVLDVAVKIGPTCAGAKRDLSMRPFRRRTTQGLFAGKDQNARRPLIARNASPKNLSEGQFLMSEPG
jgi:hypothetical protein